MNKILIPISLFAIIFGFGFITTSKAEAGACLSIPGVTPYGQCANNPGYDYAGSDGTLINPNGSRGGGWYGSSYGNGYDNCGFACTGDYNPNYGNNYNPVYRSGYDYGSNYGYGDGSNAVYGTWYGYSFANQDGYGYDYNSYRQDLRQQYPQYPTGACFKGVTFNYGCPQ